MPIESLTQVTFPDVTALFDTESVKRIDAFVDADSLATMLATLDKENPISATIHINYGANTDIIENVGFRLRGNTSLLADKKSWKLDFNEFVSGQKYEGLEKLNLKGMHNDPTLIRSKLCWDLYRDLEIPAPRASFTELYINGENYGVFCIVEHIDEEFAESRFDNNNGNLFKCTWPSDLTWQGSSPSNYNNYNYELKTNEDENNISDLIDFIYILNNSTDLECELEEVFNVNSYLKVMAADVFTGNWDGPLYNKNNFYLYHNTATGLFEYIPYDLDNTWGIDWLGVDWGNRNIYSWHNSSEPRPLYTRIMAIDTYRDKFSEYIAQLITAIDNDDYFDQINDMALLLVGAINQDPYYPLTWGYNFSDFLASFDSPIPGGSSHDDDYGITSYITARSNSAETQLDQSWEFSPSLTYFDVEDGFLDSDFIFTVQVEDDFVGTQVYLDYEINEDGIIQTVALYDDGSGIDSLAMDGIYSASLASENISLIEGQIRAIDSDGNLSLYPCDVSYIRDVEEGTYQLYINEFMPVNTSVLADEAGEYDDWIELYNGGESPIYLGNFYLTDNFEIPNKWKLPGITLYPSEYYIIWADKDEEQGINHANFKLESDTEEIAIFQPIIDRYKPIDMISYSAAIEDVSYGYLPDASQPVVEQEFPTPASANGEEVDVSAQHIMAEDISVFPNPTSGLLLIEKKDGTEVELYNVNLALVKTTSSHMLDISELQNGIYFLRMVDSFGTSSAFQKIIKN